MARLDEQFLFAADEPQQRTMRRLVALLEVRLSALEAQRAEFDSVIRKVEDVALARINETLLPASEKIISYAQFGFLIIHSSTENTLVSGEQRLFIADEGPQRDLFTPTPWVTIQREYPMGVDDYAIARVDTYHKDSGSLLVNIVMTHGNPGPFNDWTISASPGVSVATQQYYERAVSAAASIEADAAQIALDRASIQQISQILQESGLDPNLFAWRDGSRPFTAVQTGIAPGAEANNAALVTAAWVRAVTNTLSTSLNAIITTGLAGRVAVTDMASVAQIRAHTPERVIGTSGLSGALAFVPVNTVDGQGWFPDFTQFVNVQINQSGYCGVQFPQQSVAGLIGRSGLMNFYNTTTTSLAFAGGYTFDRGLVPNTTTVAGYYNLFAYSIWHPTRIHLSLIGQGIA